MNNRPRPRPRPAGVGPSPLLVVHVSFCARQMMPTPLPFTPLSVPPSLPPSLSFLAISTLSLSLRTARPPQDTLLCATNKRRRRRRRRGHPRTTKEGRRGYIYVIASALKNDHCNALQQDEDDTLKTAERNKWGKRKSLLAPPIKFTFFLHPLNSRSSILSQRTDGTIPIGPLEPCSGTAVILCTFPRVGYCEGDASSVGCNAAPFFAHCNRRRRRKEAEDGGRRPEALSSRPGKRARRRRRSWEMRAVEWVRSGTRPIIALAHPLPPPFRQNGQRGRRRKLRHS